MPQATKKAELIELKKKDKTVKLTGAERYIIQRAMERIPPGARTVNERELLEKVR